MLLIQIQFYGIYGNEFSNEINAVDYGTNSWNTTVGNSLSDYAGEDADEDADGGGIGVPLTSSTKVREALTTCS